MSVTGLFREVALIEPYLCLGTHVSYLDILHNAVTFPNSLFCIFCYVETLYLLISCEYCNLLCASCKTSLF